MPSFRQRGQEFEHRLAVGGRFLALQQHFGDCRAAAEVAVDLEWRMQTKQVRRAAADEHGQKSFRAVTVVQASPEIGFPSHAPAGGGIAAPFQRQAGAAVKIGRAGVDLTAGAQAPQMRAVAVMDVRLFGFAD